MANFAQNAATSLITSPIHSALLRVVLRAKQVFRDAKDIHDARRSLSTLNTRDLRDIGLTPQNVARLGDEMQSSGLGQTTRKQSVNW